MEKTLRLAYEIEANPKFKEEFDDRVRSSKELMVSIATNRQPKVNLTLLRHLKGCQSSYYVVLCRQMHLIVISYQTIIS